MLRTRLSSLNSSVIDSALIRIAGLKDISYEFGPAANQMSYIPEKLP